MLLYIVWLHACVRVCVWVCVCVCVCARARACVCVCLQVVHDRLVQAHKRPLRGARARELVCV